MPINRLHLPEGVLLGPNVEPQEYLVENYTSMRRRIERPTAGAYDITPVGLSTENHRLVVHNREHATHQIYPIPVQLLHGSDFIVESLQVPKYANPPKESHEIFRQRRLSAVITTMPGGQKCLWDLIFYSPEQ